VAEGGIAEARPAGVESLDAAPQSDALGAEALGGRTSDDSVESPSATS
jgi:hypothetical protein